MRSGRTSRSDTRVSASFCRPGPDNGTPEVNTSCKAPWSVFCTVPGERSLPMKQKVLSLAILCALNLLFAFACKKGENTNTSDTVYSSTTVAASDTSGTTTTNPATSSTTGTSTTNPASLTEAEQKFIEKAAFGGLAEVALGQQVSLKAKDADVKGFADKMVTDHGKANDELKDLASNKKVTLPREPDHEQQAAAKKVMSAKNIDKA